MTSTGLTLTQVAPDHFLRRHDYRALMGVAEGSVMRRLRYNVRWDLTPGAPAGKKINLVDISSLTTGPAVTIAYPPMLDGARAFSGPVCPWAP